MGEVVSSPAAYEFCAGIRDTTATTSASAKSWIGINVFRLRLLVTPLMGCDSRP